jgi:translation initiation factor IF-3
MTVAQALEEADQRGMDLIEVAPDAKPPVCRIMDYGKFRYEQQKRQKEVQKKSKQNEIKGIRVRPNTDDHDLAFKTRNALKFLRKGDKVRFTVIFRGPELRHKEIGQEQLQRFIDALADYATVDQAPRMEGRRMTMLLEPKKDMPPEIKAGKTAAQAEEARVDSGQDQNENKEGRHQAVKSDGNGTGTEPQPETQSPAVEEATDPQAASEAGQ